MIILFDLRSVGLGNNGGSLTLIKSGNTLQDMGHEVYFIDSGKNKHTWVKLEAEHIITTGHFDIPDADVIIATGFKSVRNTVTTPRRCGIKAHWIRAWETWQLPTKKIIDHILQAPTLKLVNSIGLKNKLETYNIDSKIIRPGYDLDELTPDKKQRHRETITIGGLYTTGKHDKIKRPSWIFKVYKYLKEKYVDIDLWMFGNEMMQRGVIDKYFHRPTMEAKQYMYNNIDIWLSPAIQEGLHMPPAEAMMTECPVVGVKAELSGTHDYLMDGVTGIVTKDDLGEFIKGVEKLYLNKELRLDMGERARQKIEEIGDREHNMQIMINYLQGTEDEFFTELSEYYD